VAATTFLGDALECQVAVGAMTMRLKLHPSCTMRTGDAIRVRLPEESCRALPA